MATGLLCADLVARACEEASAAPSRPGARLVTPDVMIARLPLSLPCPVPVLPGTPETMRGGELIPLEERTERCAVDAHWLFGGQPCCDVHLRAACEISDIDFDGVVAEVDGHCTCELRPWVDRFRYPQDDPALTKLGEIGVAS